MKAFKKALLYFMMFLFFFGLMNSNGWALDKWNKDDPITVEFNIIDLCIARPLGIAAGILGTGFFVISLPFTIPTRSVNDAAKMFIVEPFRFSFVREFPDDNM